jgi:hypothetical protein
MALSESRVCDIANKCDIHMRFRRPIAFLLLPGSWMNTSSTIVEWQGLFVRAIGFLNIVILYWLQVSTWYCLKRGSEPTRTYTISTMKKNIESPQRTEIMSFCFWIIVIWRIDAADYAEDNHFWIPSTVQYRVEKCYHVNGVIEFQRPVISEMGEYIPSANHRSLQRSMQ